MKKKITITEGLAQLKLLDKRIQKQTDYLEIIGVSVGEKNENGFKESESQSEYQSINDLISRRAALKMSINQSNMSTKVKVSGTEMTVLEAIEYKNTIEYKKSLLGRLRTRYNYIIEYVNENNEDVKERLDVQVKAAFEKASKKDIEDFTKTFMKNNEYKMVDPIDIKTIINNLDKEIDEFESEVDFVLSAANATTTITL